MSPGLRWILFMFVAMAVGCAHAPGPIGDRGATEFYCGPTQVVVVPEPDGITLELLGESYSLVSVVSTSGARYVTEGRDNTEFWQKNDEAQLTLAGQLWPQCIAAGTLPQPFHARGNEPFWHATFVDGELSLNALGAPEEARWQLELLDKTPEGSTYGDTSGHLHFQPARSLCRDTMTGMPYPWQVDLTVGDEQFSGCGGSAEDLLQGPVWYLTSLQGREVNPDLGVTLVFLDGQRLAGHSGCNRYGGGYELTGEGLRIGELFSTRMACMDAERTRTETDVLASLQQADRFDLNDQDGTLELWGGDQLLLQAEPRVP